MRMPVFTPSPWGFSRTYIGGEKGGHLLATAASMCAAQRGVRGEILGRDIGPQATNSYGDIDSYTKSPGDVNPTRLSTQTHRRFGVSDPRIFTTTPAVKAPSCRPIFCPLLARARLTTA